jgi:hypothetical protein
MGTAPIQHVPGWPSEWKRVEEDTSFLLSVRALQFVRDRKKLCHVFAVLCIVRVPVGVLVFFRIRLDIVTDETSTNSVGNNLGNQESKVFGFL